MSAALALLFSAALASAPEAHAVRRYALLVGANDGGAARPHLRYAIADAQEVGRVLSQLGGVAPADRRLLEEPSPEALRAALTALSAELAAHAGRAEVLLYYSGHSDEQGLLLGGQPFSYAELREWLAHVPAAVRIAILDSCASGAATRAKGGTRVAPFLLDASTRVEGHAILTSSAETEASQESDRVGGSFFTHYLLSGLRGAADASSDGRITLNEAYRYSFEETLARTEKTRAGAQHPAYDIQLVGTGDWVMTDLHQASSTFVLPEAAGGRYFVRDDAGNLVAELRKVPGRAVELGLEPGNYTVTREDGGALAEGRFVLASGARVVIEGGAFSPVAREATRSRGDETPLVDVPVSLSLWPSIRADGETRELHAFSLGLTAGYAAQVEGVSIALGADLIEERLSGLQLAVGLTWTGASMEGVQLSAGVAWAEGHARGLQLAGVGDVSTGAAAGAQIAGAFTWADALDGAQIAGAVNVASRLRGLQLGVVNVGGSISGLQVGVVNIATEEGGEALGLLNFLAGGLHRPEVWASDTTPVNVSAKLGGQTLYTVLSVGVLDRERWAYGLGLGARVTLDERWALHVDAISHFVAPFSSVEAQEHWNVLRAMVDLRLFEHLSVTAGPTLNLAFGDRAGAATTAGHLPAWTFSLGDRPARVWLGAAVGVGF